MAWKIVGTAAMAAALLGCSVHTQSPVRYVAYDFSDHAYYDRGYAPSPSYAAAPGYYEAGASMENDGCPYSPRGESAGGDCDCEPDHSEAGTSNRRPAIASRGGHDRDDAEHRDDARRPSRPRINTDADEPRAENDRDAGRRRIDPSADRPEGRPAAGSSTRPVFSTRR